MKRSFVRTLLVSLTVFSILAPGIASAGRLMWWPTHQYGNSGRNVVTIQYLLRARGYTVTVNGSFDSQTDTAVKQFQSSRGLAADGIVGNLTWEALVTTVQQGSTNSWAVRGVQDQLKNRYGYSTMLIDGVFGSGTRSAVIGVQTTKGLTADGIVGTNTWNALVNYGNLDHTNAKNQLINAGITNFYSTGSCTDRYYNNCTSLEQIRQSTISGLIRFKNESRCAIRFQGGTETGHQDGTYSHWNGYKVDIARDCVSTYIYNNFTPIGGSKYRDAYGNIFFDEDAYHWDITFY